MLAASLASNLHAAESTVSEELLKLDLIQLQKVRVVTVATLQPALDANPTASFVNFSRSASKAEPGRKAGPFQPSGPGLNGLLEQNKAHLTTVRQGRPLEKLACTIDTAH